MLKVMQKGKSRAGKKKNKNLQPGRLRTAIPAHGLLGAAASHILLPPEPGTQKVPGRAWCFRYFRHQSSRQTTCEEVLSPIFHLRKLRFRKERWFAQASQGQELDIWFHGSSPHVTLRPAGKTGKSLGFNILFISRPLLFELVVTPGALGPSQPETGHRKLR